MMTVEFPPFRFLAEAVRRTGCTRVRPGREKPRPRPFLHLFDHQGRCALHQRVEVRDVAHDGIERVGQRADFPLPLEIEKDVDRPGHVSVLGHERGVDVQVGIRHVVLPRRFGNLPVGGVAPGALAAFSFIIERNVVFHEDAGRGDQGDLALFERFFHRCPGRFGRVRVALRQDAITRGGVKIESIDFFNRHVYPRNQMRHSSGGGFPPHIFLIHQAVFISHEILLSYWHCYEIFIIPNLVRNLSSAVCNRNECGFVKRW